MGNLGKVTSGDCFIFGNLKSYFFIVNFSSIYRITFSFGDSFSLGSIACYKSIDLFILIFFKIAGFY